MAGSGSGPEQPTPAELLKYGDLCEVSYDNFKVSEHERQAAMSSLTAKSKEHMDSSPAGAEASEGPGEAALDLKDLGFLVDWLSIGYKFGKPWYLISKDDAEHHHQKSGLPVWQPELAKQYWGYKDLWSFSGMDNVNAPPDPMKRLAETPSWAGYVAYRKPAEGDAADRGELVFVFRGTQLKSEWVSDFIAGITVWQTPADYSSARPGMGKVHKGFYHMYNAGSTTPGSRGKFPKQVVEEVLQAAKSQQSPFKDHPFPRVSTVGHSLGGALATLCALHVADWLEQNGVPTSKEDVTAYTYDAPRVGNDVLAAQIEKRVTVWRMVNKHDLAPHVPPEGPEEVDYILQRTTHWLLQYVLKWLLRVLQFFGVVREFKWRHAGVLLEYDPIELGHQLGKDSPYDPNRKWDGGDHHNLQLLLYAMAKQANIPRDLTSINKGADILKPELNIPPSFWDPAGTPPNKGVPGFPQFIPPGYQ